jgi:hypothetical protein
MAANIDSCSRVAIFPPRTAGTRVLLDDDEWQACLPKANASKDPGHTATDDDDGRRGLHFLWDFVTPGDSARISAVELQVVEEEPGKAPLHRPAAEKRHHLLQELMRQLLRQATAVAVGPDRRQSQLTSLRSFIRRDAALYVQRHCDPRTNVATDPCGIARHVHEGAQERRDTHVLKRRRNLLVVIGKRLGCVGVSSHLNAY